MLPKRCVCAAMQLLVTSGCAQSPTGSFAYHATASWYASEAATMRCLHAHGLARSLNFRPSEGRATVTVMPKARKGGAKPQRITVEEFDRDPNVIAAARKDGGLLVVDAQGNPQFTFWIPNAALPAARR